MEGYAVFSDCMRYRYLLTRRIPNVYRTILYIMLNPSTADADVNDPTITRCWKRALAMGYGQMIVVNLFALRGTNPRDLRMVADPIGPQNDMYLGLTAALAHTIVVGWGDHGVYQQRGRRVLELLHGQFDKYLPDSNLPRTLHCLKVNKGTRQPIHPLYCAMSMPLIEYKEDVQ